MVKAKTKAGNTSALPSAKRAKTRQGTSTSRITNQEKLTEFKGRGLYNFKFPPVESMEELGVLEGVKRLFDNIGWVKLLEWFDMGYQSLTIDFLSSVRLEDDELHFRMFKKDCVLSMNTICQMIDAPIDNTFGPDDSTHANFHAKEFWRSITVNSKYESSHLKASYIIHPVLRMTHRLLSYIVDSRGDAGTVTLQELYLLWCMIFPNSVRPNFGKYLCHKLLQVSTAKKGKVCCGSVITILARHESLNLQFPHGLEELKGSQYLDVYQMIKMKLLKLPEMGPRHHWLKGEDPFIRITKHNRDRLLLANPVAETESKLGLNVLGINDDSEPEADNEELADHSQGYMARFTIIDTELASIRADMNHIRNELTDQQAKLREMVNSIAFIHNHLVHLRSPPPPHP